MSESTAFQPTLEDVKKRVQDVYDMRGDDESAHSAEDGLHSDVLAWIANGSVSGDDAPMFANEALKTLAMDFARWCA